MADNTLTNNPDGVLWNLLGEPDVDVPRILHAGEEWTGQPYVYVDDSIVEVAAGDQDRPDRGIAVTAEFGTQITGPCSIAEMPQNISIAAYYRVNPLVLACIGSSAAVPIPWLVWSTPRILASSADMQSIGAGLGI